MVSTTPHNQEFADRLRLAMKEAGLGAYGSAARLARELKVTPKAVAKWLQGDSTPTVSRIGELAKFLSVDPEWLLWGERKGGFFKEGEIRPRRTVYFDESGEPVVLGREGAGFAGSEIDSGADALARHPDVIQISVWDDDTPVDEDEVEVPFLREVELSAGSGRTVIQESSRAKLRFGKITLRKHSVQFDQAVCVPVHGNSMEPVLPDGSTVAINKGSTTVVDGKIYAIAHGGQLRVKTLYRLPGGGIRMRSFNRDEHPDEEYTESDMKEHEITILGRVFWSAAFH
ncbi:XRE family transcriptional regulator [Pseudomonas fluorescens]|uniref:XRE family transcriptional regulator n=1 Tax=Pseudomonas fluorescens TaxID=294 RepID=UPI0009B9FDF5|nr:helix-turn-helix transcriptional regulator [Pseudomonas fluorescens]